MSNYILKIACLLLVALLVLPAVSSMVRADNSSDESPGSGKGGKGGGGGGGKNKDTNAAPVVTILEPTATEVGGNTIQVVVSVVDEDENAVAVISVDLVPVFNTGNTVTIDISGWVTGSQHVITAAYTDTGGKNGGDDILVTKI